MSKHTPGPWHYEVVGISGDHSNPTDICEITNGYTRIAENVSLEDARLIAAVPEQHAALEDVVMIIEHYANNPKDCISRLQVWLTLGNAALWKAEGQ